MKDDAGLHDHYAERVLDVMVVMAQVRQTRLVGRLLGGATFVAVLVAGDVFVGLCFRLVIAVIAMLALLENDGPVPEVLDEEGQEDPGHGDGGCGRLVVELTQTVVGEHKIGVCEELSGVS